MSDLIPDNLITEAKAWSKLSRGTTTAEIIDRLLAVIARLQTEKADAAATALERAADDASEVEPYDYEDSRGRWHGHVNVGSWLRARAVLLRDTTNALSVESQEGNK